MENQKSNCGCNNNSCCSSVSDKKEITIDFLHLDLSVCERCQGAEGNLDQAVNEVIHVLNAAGYEIIVNKVNIKTKELAIKHKFLSSPTIRVNGNDIDMDIKESKCKDCGDLCGDITDCRIWVYEGSEYTEPPKAMITNSILKEVYDKGNVAQQPNGEYVLPQNLETFFEGLLQKTNKLIMKKEGV